MASDKDNPQEYVEEDVEFDASVFKGKRILISGASSGTGEEFAYQYASYGARLVLTARRENLLEKVTEKCNEISGAKIHSYTAADMTDLTEPARVVKFAIEKLGGLDILVVNHGIIPYYRPWNGDKEYLSHSKYVMDCNFFSYLHMFSAATDTLNENNGTLIIMSSIGGKLPLPFGSIYTAAKHALVGFFDTVRFEWKQKKMNISITILNLGYADTERSLRTVRDSGCFLGCSLREDRERWPTTQRACKAMIHAALTKKRFFFYPKHDMWVDLCARSLHDPTVMDRFLEDLTVAPEDYQQQEVANKSK